MPFFVGPLNLGGSGTLTGDLARALRNQYEPYGILNETLYQGPGQTDAFGNQIGFTLQNNPLQGITPGPNPPLPPPISMGAGKPQPESITGSLGVDFGGGPPGGPQGPSDSGLGASPSDSGPPGATSVAVGSGLVDTGVMESGPTSAGAIVGGLVGSLAGQAAGAAGSFVVGRAGAHVGAKTQTNINLAQKGFGFFGMPPAGSTGTATGIADPTVAIENTIPNPEQEFPTEAPPMVEATQTAGPGVGVVGPSIGEGNPGAVGVSTGPVGVVGTADTPGGPGAGGAGDGGGTVICTELYRLGYLSEAEWAADKRFGRAIDPLVYRGYLQWAPTMVRWSRQSRWFRALAAPVALQWAHEMAFQMGARPKGTRLGWVLMLVGLPMCRWLGRHATDQSRPISVSAV